jgi:pimeloyl-ACP methyl ester carboxylesterase
MEPFARFLIAMGYPAERVRNPHDGSLSTSSFTDSAELAGALAFDYERTGLAPMLIGHSQGGMLALRTLYELAGAFHDALHVVDPATGEALARTSIVDPRTGASRPVVGLHVAYAAALATGWLPRLVLGQWSMLPRLRRIPDTVDEFTGFSLPHDAIAGTWLGDTPYEALGSARVRNVALPSSYHHVTLPRVDLLARDAAIRASLDAWSPDDPPASPHGDTTNLVQAADVWYSVKRHWCLQAQRLLRIPVS